MNERIVRPTAPIRDVLKQHTKAAKRARAVAEIETLVKGGVNPTAALESVAHETGISKRSLFTYLKKTKGVPHGQWEEALTRTERTPRAKVILHPDALKLAIYLRRKGYPDTECHRQIEAAAPQKGWGPIPSARTLSRELDRHVPSSERWMARRSAKRIGGL